MESIRKYIECFFGRLKQRFKILRTPILLRNKTDIDNMVFAIVAIQNMIQDHKVVAEEISSWEVQHNWMKVDTPGLRTFEEVMESLTLAEEEDVCEESDPKWCRPLVKKKRKLNTTALDEWYDRGTDFSFVGLRGEFSPAQFGWDEKVLPKGEKEGFNARQKLLVQHYAWFWRNNQELFWLRS